MTKRIHTPYRDGYLAGLTNKVRAAPQAFHVEQREVWLKGYDDAQQNNRRGTLTREGRA